MQTFNSDSNSYHLCVAGLSRNLFCILHNVPNVVTIVHKGHNAENTLYAHLIRIVYTDIRTFLLKRWRM